MGAAEDCDWKRLADRVVVRREELDLRTRHQLAEQTGLSYRVLGDLERGSRGVSEGTLAIVEQALGWMPGSAKSVLHGGEPTIAGQLPPARGGGEPSAMRAGSAALRLMNAVSEGSDAAKGVRLAETISDIIGSLGAGDVHDPAPSAHGGRAAAHEVGGSERRLRQALGSYIRHLRERRGLTEEVAIEMLDCSPDHLRRLEDGHAELDDLTIPRILKAYGADDSDFRAELMWLTAALTRSGWWTQYDDVVPKWFEQYIGLEQQAESIRTVEMAFVPGLLQTADYASWVLRASGVGEVTQRVEMRIGRQNVLFGPSPPKLWAILDEGIFKRVTARPEVMLEQIEHLLYMAGKRNVTIQILAWKGAPALTAESFSHLRFGFSETVPDLVYIEQFTSAVYISRRDHIAAYSALMDRLGVAALSPEDSILYLRRLKKSYAARQSRGTS